MTEERCLYMTEERCSTAVVCHVGSLKAMPKLQEYMTDRGAFFNNMFVHDRGVLFVHDRSIVQQQVCCVSCRFPESHAQTAGVHDRQRSLLQQHVCTWQRSVVCTWQRSVVCTWQRSVVQQQVCCVSCRFPESHAQTAGVHDRQRSLLQQHVCTWQRSVVCTWQRSVVCTWQRSVVQQQVCCVSCRFPESHAQTAGVHDRQRSLLQQHVCTWQRSVVCTWQRSVVQQQVCCVSCRFPESHAQTAGVHDRQRSLLQQHVCVHAHVLPIQKLHPDWPLRPQPQRLHQQRQLLLIPVGQGPRATHLCCVPAAGWVQNRWLYLRCIPAAVWVQNRWLYLRCIPAAV